MKLLCVKCNVELRVKANDVAVIRISTNPPRARQVWNADLLACSSCGDEIVTGFGIKPFLELGETVDFDGALAGVCRRSYVIRSYESIEDAKRLSGRPLDSLEDDAA